MKCPGHARYSTATADINLFMVRLGCFRDIRYSTVLQRPRPRPALLAAMVCDATDALPFLLRIRGREAAISRPSDCRQPLHTVGRRCAMLPSYHDDLRGHWAPPACPVPFPKVAEIAGNSQSQCYRLPLANQCRLSLPLLPTRGSSRASQRLDAVEATEKVCSGRVNWPSVDCVQRRPKAKGPPKCDARKR